MDRLKWPLLSACAFFLGLAGCQLPGWSTRSASDVSVPVAAREAVASAEAGDAADPLPGTAADPLGAGTEPDLKAMVEILSQVEAVGQLDPEAREQLIDDLRNTKPSLWPAMVQQFRAALAFRQQLEVRQEHHADGESIRADLADHTAAAPVGSSGASDPSDEVVPLSHVTDVPESPSGPKPVASLSALPAGSPPAPLRRPISSVSPASPAPQVTSPVRSTRTPSTERAVVLPSHGVQGGDRLDRLAPAESVAGQPGRLDRPDLWRDDLSHVIRALEQQTGTVPHSADEVSRHAQLRMLYLAAGRSDDALRPIDGISPAQQDFWSQQLYGLATYLDSERLPDVGRRAAAARRYLRDAESKLGELGMLTVQNLALCTEVSSFGVYQEFEKNNFSPGQEVLLYAEVENFTSEETDKGCLTALRSSYRILDGEGRRVDHHEFEITEDYCKNRRRDFFMRYFIRIPGGLHAGTYTLQLTIEDTLAHKIGESSISLTIGKNGD